MAVRNKELNGSIYTVSGIKGGKRRRCGSRKLESINAGPANVKRHILSRGSLVVDYFKRRKNIDERIRKKSKISFNNLFV